MDKLSKEEFYKLFTKRRSDIMAQTRSKPPPKNAIVEDYFADRYVRVSVKRKNKDWGLNKITMNNRDFGRELKTN